MAKIGIFDSGLGGLLILNSIRQLLPDYDYVYYGDTANVPYGQKTQEQIQQLTIAGVEFLVKQNCSLIILACNTASAKALRYIQQQCLPLHYPQVKVLGVIIPTLEAVRSDHFPAGLIATQSTVESEVYEKQLNLLFPRKQLHSLAAPQLAELIQNQQIDLARSYAQQVIEQLPGPIKSLILACTHYSAIAFELASAYPDLQIIDQTKIIPPSLQKYLSRHREIEKKLSRNKTVDKHFTGQN